MGVKREVRLSDSFRAEAAVHFPPGGSIDGKPPWEMFEKGPLRAAIQAFGEDFEGNAIAYDPVRIVQMPPTVFFPPMTIYAILVEDWVEIMSIDVDSDYFGRINDPDDWP